MSDAPPLTAATPDDVEGAIDYALRFDARGRPLTKGARENTEGMARWIREHLERSNFRIVRAPGARPHSTG